MAYKNSGAMKFNDATDLVIRADPDGTVESCFNLVDNTEYIIPAAYTHIATAEITLNNFTTTSATAVGNIILGPEYYTGHKMLYVKVRDKAGMRDGYFYGSDMFLANNQAAMNKTGFTGTAIRNVSYYDTSLNNYIGVVASGGGISTAYGGVYGGRIDPTEGKLEIEAMYSSTYSKKIDGTYIVDVYMLDWPDGDNLMGDNILR